MVEGIILGAMTFTGFAITYSRLPEGVRMFAARHPILTDVIMVTFFYGVMGMTITAHFAVAAMTGLTMFGLHMVRNKADFQFVWDFMDTVKGWVDGGMESLKKLNAATQAAKLAKLNAVEVIA